jgi:DMSO/TMAO reductase YedYZ molybdopterin-dependent catalytic subunit
MQPEFGMKRPDQVKTAPDQGLGERVPPGQFVSQKFPVLTYGSAPQVDLKTWKIRVFGLVEQEVELDWEEFTRLDWVAVTADFHCVTQWSSLDNLWEGVLFSTLVSAARPKPEARFVMAHCYGGYTTNLPLGVAVEEGLLAHKQNGEELARDHGWPLRLIIPSRYAWKSAKWVNGIELLAEDSPGFWEQRGYSNNADPWKEERFWPELTK